MIQYDMNKAVRGNIPNPLVAQARTYLGVPWRHMGRTRRGVDCAGLLICAYADLGIVVPVIEHYGREPHRDGLMSGVRKALGEPVLDGPKVGDIVVMTSAAFGATQPHHLGIIGDDPHHGLSLIHADGEPSVSRVSEVGLSDQYRRRIVAVFRRAV
jgi:cell wall-associated NlpC family hydrolase